MRKNEWDWDYDSWNAEVDVRDYMLSKFFPVQPLVFES